MAEPHRAGGPADLGAGRWAAQDGDDLDMALVAAELQAQGRACELEHVAITDSTNTRLLHAAASGAPAPRALFAEMQTAGRGRRGRAWVGRYGDGLMFSLLVDSGRTVRELPGLALAAGAWLAEAIEGLGVGGVGVKWPNDVMLDGAKLAGVLVEAVPARAGQAVIGVGLNWRLPPAGAIEPGRSASALSTALTGDACGRSRVAGLLLASLLAAAERFRDEGLPSALAAFARHDVLAGQEIDVLAGDTRRRGIALGLAEDGALRVRHGDIESRYQSAEVSIRPA